jgi:hypothetical protein
MINQKQKDKIDQIFETGGLQAFWESLRTSVLKADSEAKRKMLASLLDYAVQKANDSSLESSKQTDRSTVVRPPSGNNNNDESNSENEDEPIRLFTFMNSQKPN